MPFEKKSQIPIDACVDAFPGYDELHNRAKDLVADSIRLLVLISKRPDDVYDRLEEARNNLFSPAFRAYSKQPNPRPHYANQENVETEEEEAAV